MTLSASCTSVQGHSGSVFDIDSSVDAGPVWILDAGELDAGLTCSVSVAVLDDESWGTGITPSGDLISVELLGSITGTQAAVWGRDGQVTGVQARVRLFDGGLEYFDGGFREAHAPAMSAVYLGGSVQSFYSNPMQPYRMRAPFEEMELLGDGRGGRIYAINDQGVAVGESLGGEGRIWFSDGGIWRAVGQSQLLGVGSDGIAVGSRRSPQTPTNFEAILVQSDGSVVTLAAGQAATAIVATRIVGGAHVWVRPTLEHRLLESSGFLDFGATCLSAGGMVAGGAAFLEDDPNVFQGIGAIWKDEKLLWTAPVVTDGGLQIVSIEGCAADGREFAAFCARGDTRHACRVTLACQQ